MLCEADFARENASSADQLTYNISAELSCASRSLSPSIVSLNSKPHARIRKAFKLTALVLVDGIECKCYGFYRHIKPLKCHSYFSVEHFANFFKLEHKLSNFIQIKVKRCEFANAVARDSGMTVMLTNFNKKDRSIQESIFSASLSLKRLYNTVRQLSVNRTEQPQKNSSSVSKLGEPS